MLAVIKTGGKQYTVKEGDELLVEKISAKDGTKVKLDGVLLISNEKTVTIGQPLVKKGKVNAKLLSQEKGPKLIIFKYKRRKKYRRKIGHRQQYSRIKIEKIEV